MVDFRRLNINVAVMASSMELSMSIKNVFSWCAGVVLVVAAGYAAAGGGAAVWGQFGNANGPDADGGMSFPTGAEAWAGWANTNTDMYPMSFASGGTVKFKASAENGDVDVYFRFERLPYPDVDPAFSTDTVTLSGEARNYCVDIADRPADQTYSSFLLYTTTQDVYFGMTDVVVTEGGDCADDGYNPTNAGDINAIPALPLWAFGMLAGLMALFGWRARR